MIQELLGLGVAAALTENVVFCRGFSYGLQYPDKRRLATLLATGGMATLFTVIASFCGWLGRYITGNELVRLLTWTKPALLIAIYGVAIVLMMVMINLSRNLNGGRRAKISTKLVYGFIPLGTLFIVGNSQFSLLQSLFYGMGAGVGFLLAVLLNYSLQKRLIYSNVPMAFRGVPVTLLTYGLLSLAIYGLLGHPLTI